MLNSGFTFREYDYLNNARQVPKLPDWAIVDVTTPPDSRKPGKVVAADFFDESLGPQAAPGLNRNAKSFDAAKIVQARLPLPPREKEEGTGSEKKMAQPCRA